jgi:hypothetical protein
MPSTKLRGPGRPLRCFSSSSHALLPTGGEFMYHNDRSVTGRPLSCPHCCNAIFGQLHTITQPISETYSAASGSQSLSGVCRDIGGVKAEGRDSCASPNSGDLVSALRARPQDETRIDLKSMLQDRTILSLASLYFQPFQPENSSIVTNIYQARRRQTLVTRRLSDCLLCHGRKRPSSYRGSDGGSFGGAARSGHVKP